MVDHYTTVHIIERCTVLVRSVMDPDKGIATKGQRCPGKPETGRILHNIWIKLSTMSTRCTRDTLKIVQGKASDYSSLASLALPTSVTNKVYAYLQLQNRTCVRDCKDSGGQGLQSSEELK